MRIYTNIICMYVCMHVYYVCMYVCIHIWLYVCTCIHIRMYALIEMIMVVGKFSRGEYVVLKTGEKYSRGICPGGKCPGGKCPGELSVSLLTVHVCRGVHPIGE